MKIALIGATGYVGAKVLAEALARGHTVTGIVLHPEKLPVHARLTPKKGDVANVEDLATLLRGHEAVLSAFSPEKSAPDLRGRQVLGARAILSALKKAQVKRLLVVGGAGSLEVAPGVQGVDTPEFPAEWREGALGTRDVLQLLQDETELEWTFLSPSANLAPGVRTGKFRLGTDLLLKDAKGESRISLEDYAMAFIDEIEHPHHVRRRFTVGY